MIQQKINKPEDINLLVESIKLGFDQKGFIIEPEPHFERLFRSIKALGFACVGDSFEAFCKKLRSEINLLLSPALNAAIYKIRLVYGRDASYDFEILPYAGIPQEAFACALLDPGFYHAISGQEIHRHKFLPRPELPKHEGYELIWLNEKNQICEGSYTNIFWRSGEEAREIWRTPHLGCGILPGTFRQKFLEELQKRDNCTVEEGFFGPEELLKAKQIILTNALIGAKEAKLIFL
jgi:4-amino-4-deoxychorismate lyase